MRFVSLEQWEPLAGFKRDDLMYMFKILLAALWNSDYQEMKLEAGTLMRRQ